MRTAIALLAALALLVPAAPAADPAYHVRDVGWVFPDFEMLFPAPCIGDEILFRGDIISTDNYVLASGLPHDGALHDNWRSWYDGEWTAVGSGATYELAPGSLNHAVVLIPDGPVDSMDDLTGLHQTFRYALSDVQSGERLTLSGRITLVRNAAGEIVVENVVLDGCKVSR